MIHFLSSQSVRHMRFLLSLFAGIHSSTFNSTCKECGSARQMLVNCKRNYDQLVLILTRTTGSGIVKIRSDPHLEPILCCELQRANKPYPHPAVARWQQLSLRLSSRTPFPYTKK